jgi:lysophospholipid acyltransferase (LPLAT)-like uncharacterized protein
MKSRTKPFTVEVRKRRGSSAKDEAKRALSKLIDKLRSGSAVAVPRP